MLPREKVERELGYLQIAVEKTAGPREHEAWRLLDREDRGPLQARLARAPLGPLSRNATKKRGSEERGAGTMSELREVTGTAFVVAEFRARENEEPHPLYVDPIVCIFLDARTRAAADAIRADFPAGENMPRLRTRYYDDRLGEQIAQGCRQVVILGAGLDTRGVRKRAAGVAYFEIDDAGTLELEEGALRGEQDRCAGDLHPRQLRRLRRDPAARGERLRHGPAELLHLGRQHDVSHAPGRDEGLGRSQAECARVSPSPSTIWTRPWSR